MSTFGEPKRPAEGWETRWALQSWELLLRSPLTLIIGVIGIPACAFVFVLLKGIFPGFYGLLPYIATNALAVLVPVGICASLAVFEKHGIGNKADVLKGLRDMIIMVFVYVGVIVTIMGFLISPEGPVMERGDLWSIRFVVYSIGVAFTVLTFVNILWVVLVTQVPMSLSQMYWNGKRLISGIPECKAIYFVTILVTFLSFILPLLLSIPMQFFFSVWLYVAGREIYGGISSNTYREARVSVSPVEA